MNKNDSLADTPILISIIPNLMGGEGHIIPYHIAVTKAANLLGWKHIAAVPPDAGVQNLPSNWYPCLSDVNLEAKINPLIRILRFNDVWHLGKTIANFLKKEVLPGSNYPIIFTERFIHIQLFALLIALYLTPRKNLSVWLLYRRDTHKDKTRWIYKLLNKLIKQILEPGKFHLLTDSEFLSKSLENYFQEVVTVMPIPHTHFINVETNSQTSIEIKCWWPGTPRMEKGWDKIKSLVTANSDLAKHIHLVAAQSSELLQSINGVQVKLIANYLTEEEYLHWLKTSDIILLPYDNVAYSERTSGIFTECIIAGKIPIVTQGTWMAKELIKHGLNELIIDWSQPTLIVEQIINIAKSEVLKYKIEAMQTDYQNFHSIENYGNYMNQLLNFK
ncbi:hypothetical protein [Anabaena azotica]|uniref:hypothetical protein n=1 Tax=Anabaena azotica TaxID=197653 RepID=UPI0039A5720F